MQNRVLRVTHVDSGWELLLPDGRGAMSCRWNARGVTNAIVRDAMGRVTRIDEGLVNEVREPTEHISYGSADAVQGMRGRTTGVDDTFGSRRIDAFALDGQAQIETLRFINTVDLPDVSIESEPPSIFENDTYVTHAAQDATGLPYLLTDAGGHQHRYRHDVAGRRNTVEVVPGTSTATHVVIGKTSHDAADHTESEVGGNGMISQACRDVALDRLAHLCTTRDTCTLDQRIYQRDPHGLIVAVDRIESTSAHESFTYTHDTLYRLVASNGWKGEPGARHAFAQSFTYDLAGNVTEWREASGGETHTHGMMVADTSNRSLPVSPDMDPDINTAFDACGNMLRMDHGQALTWDLRGRLSKRSIPSTGFQASCRYDSEGRRRVLTTIDASSSIAQTKYLPGMEWHTTSAPSESIHTVRESGNYIGAYLLHWPEGVPSDATGDRMRHTGFDHLGSVVIETDEAGHIIRDEGFHAYGETAWCHVPNPDESRCDTSRYSGKERDIDGMYDYGFRYYHPGSLRWLSPDPSGDVDGLNLYRMARNDPINWRDTDGRESTDDSFSYLDPLMRNGRPRYERVQYVGLDLLRRYWRNEPDPRVQRIRRSIPTAFEARLDAGQHAYAASYAAHTDVVRHIPGISSFLGQGLYFTGLAVATALPFIVGEQAALSFVGFVSQRTTNFTRPQEEMSSNRRAMADTARRIGRMATAHPRFRLLGTPIWLWGNAVDLTQRAEDSAHAMRQDVLSGDATHPHWQAAERLTQTGRSMGTPHSWLPVPEWSTRRRASTPSRPFS